MTPTKNIPLLIGIALPIVFIIIISIVIFTPSLFIKPQYNFLYSTENSMYMYGDPYENKYDVSNGHLVLAKLPVKKDVIYKPGNPPLYIYDVKSNTVHEVTFEEAQQYTLDIGPSSPDGYTVRYQYGNSGIFEIFGSNSNQSGYVISKGNGSKKLGGLSFGSYNYYGATNFQLIGWIK